MDTQSVKSIQVVERAKLCIGVPYVYGAEASVDETPPKALDCSELVEWVCRGLGLTMPDGSGNQMKYCSQHGTTTTVDQAWLTQGALLFRRNSKSHRIEHVGITDGKGHTIEARGVKYGTGIFNRRSNWTDAALIPGVDYV